MRILRSIFWLIIFTVIVGCSPGDAPADQTAAPVEVSPTNMPVATEIPTATALPPIVVLLASPEADQSIVETLQAELSQSIPGVGFRFQVRPSLSTEAIVAENIHWVIALPPTSGLTDLVLSSPGTRFLAVGVKELQPAPNLSMIGSDRERFDQQGFMAGYIAAMLTPDWRVGVISIADSDAGQIARKSFITGVKYFCGFCSPTYPPFYEYPLYVQLNSGASTDEWQAAADFLIQRGVTTMYVVPGVGDATLLRYLQGSGIAMIGGVTPPVDVRESWIATLGFPPLEAFYSFWPEFVNGSDGQTISVPLSISDINSTLLSPGKQRLIEEVFAEVQGEYIELIGRNIP